MVSNNGDMDCESTLLGLFTHQKFDFVILYEFSLFFSHQFTFARWFKQEEKSIDFGPTCVQLIE